MKNNWGHGRRFLYRRDSRKGETDRMAKIKRQIIEIDEEKCDGCGACVISCPEGALHIINGKARVVKENFCDGLGACIGECPQGALTIKEDEVEEYDEEGVIAHIKKNSPKLLEKHLSHLRAHAVKLPSTPASCPSAQTLQWENKEDFTGEKIRLNSELHQWPVQIHLVSPDAPYFKKTDLILVADCVPVAYANFHQDFLKGKTIVMGCPMLDDTDAYLKKITQILRNSDIKRSGKDIPLKQRTVGIKGNIIKE